MGDITCREVKTNENEKGKFKFLCRLWRHFWQRLF